MIKIAVCGRSASGKDYVCRQISHLTRLRYFTSTSRTMADVVYAASTTTPELAGKYSSSMQCFEDRRHYRKFWSSVISSYNFPNRTKLYEDILASNDILNGIWCREDLQCCVTKGIIDLSIWIERSGLDDPAIDFGPESCDMTIHHAGSSEELDAKIHRLCSVLI